HRSPLHPLPSPLRPSRRAAAGGPVPRSLAPAPPGVYSVVRFRLEPEGEATRLVIDHAAIPHEWEEHIESGYPAFYRDPLIEFFAGECEHLG
ncbi:MAG TPA: hypothetical protein VHQ97_05750, partial [Solirubrobacterales bacterium]|nr:hypothetical protein [Solirubrobacterales bacterium]